MGDSGKILENYDSYERRGPRRLGKRGDALISRERDQTIHQLGATLSATRVLDMGCAGGDVLRSVAAIARAETAVGVDIRVARMGRPDHGTPSRFFVGADASHLPFAAGTFELVVAFTLWSSLPSDAMKRAAATEAARVLAPDGKVLWYDMRYPNPFNRRVSPVSRSDLQQWFPGFRVEVQPVTLIPQIARVLGPFVDKMYEPLARIKVLRSHYIGIIERR